MSTQAIYTHTEIHMHVYTQTYSTYIHTYVTHT